LPLSAGRCPLAAHRSPPAVGRFAARRCPLGARRGPPRRSSAAVL